MTLDQVQQFINDVSSETIREIIEYAEIVLEARKLDN